MVQSLLDLETNTDLDSDLSDTVCDQRHVEVGREEFKRLAPFVILPKIYLQSNGSRGFDFEGDATYITM